MLTAISDGWPAGTALSYSWAIDGEPVVSDAPVLRMARAAASGAQFVVPADALGKRITVTISIGLTTLERKGEQVADVLKRADTALYRAKHDGRNRVVSAAA